MKRLRKLYSMFFVLIFLFIFFSCTTSKNVHSTNNEILYYSIENIDDKKINNFINEDFYSNNSLTLYNTQKKSFDNEFNTKNNDVLTDFDIVYLTNDSNVAKLTLAWREKNLKINGKVGNLSLYVDAPINKGFYDFDDVIDWAVLYETDEGVYNLFEKQKLGPMCPQVEVSVRKETDYVYGGSTIHIIITNVDPFKNPWVIYDCIFDESKNAFIRTKMLSMDYETIVKSDISKQLNNDISISYLTDKSNIEYHIKDSNNVYDSGVVNECFVMKVNDNNVYTDFHFFEVGLKKDDFEWSPYEKQIIFSFNEWTYEKPIVIKADISELFPYKGISFIDENGNRRYYTITWNYGSYLEFRAFYID